jgi:DNA-binding response OmpR family regulator
MIATANPKNHLERRNFRFALVVEESHSLRNSVVEVLKAQEWLVHGILGAEQALNILAYIPYRLIVIDSELPGICGMDFVRILKSSREWRWIQLVILSNAQSASLASEAAECGAVLIRKTRWREELSSFLLSYDEELSESGVEESIT